jgi:hypothetical protein
VSTPSDVCTWLRDSGTHAGTAYSQVRRLAAVAGTQEPEYGPEAIQPVGKTAGDPAFTELAKKDLKWATLDYTNVESQTFYLFTDEGRVGFVQVIYSNVA